MSTTAQPQSTETATAPHEYWVTRVVRNMNGASPSRIDSVIQANLPPRRIRWSERPDTLEIPGLKGQVPYESCNIPNCYELGFFRDNEFLHPELTVNPRGIPSDTKPYHMGSDSNITSVIVICFFVLSFVVHHSRRFISFQSQHFLQSPQHSNKHLSEDTTGDVTGALLTLCVLACTICILYLYHVQNAFNMFLCYMPQHYLLGIYCAVAVVFLLGREVMAAFINWIFFNVNSRQEWRQSYRFLLLLETVVLLPVVVTGVFMELPPKTVILSALIVVALSKTALLYKTFSTFSFRIYGLLHLLSYLCALEIIPLLLWVVLGRITSSLTITF